MRQPTFDVISQGTMAIRRFAKLDWRIRTDVVFELSATQNMFNLIEQFDLGDKVDDMLSLTPAPPHDEDGYFAFVLDRFLPSKIIQMHYSQKSKS